MENKEGKPDRERDITTGLLRQRRNLIGISMAIIFYYFGDVQISEINLFGNKIPIGNITIVPVFIWFLYAYFLYRYWIYFKEEPDHRFTSDYLMELDDTCSPILKKIALRQNNQELSPELLKEVLEERRFSIRKYGNYKSLSFLKAESNALRPGTREEEKHPDAHVTAIYFKARFWHLYFVTLCKMASKDSRFSDYYLPFILAFFAVMSWLWSLSFLEQEMGLPLII